MILYEKKNVIALIKKKMVLYSLSLSVRTVRGHAFIGVFDTYKSGMPSFHLEPMISAIYTPLFLDR